jgi:predicted ATPase
MRFTRIRLENWRNFLSVDVPLQRRMFLVGPNASGKSNFLDAFRFLRDIADPQGGFQRAVSQTRRGVSQIRSLHARRGNVVIEVEADLDGEAWTYRIEFSQDNQRRPLVQKEIVLHQEQMVLSRPDSDDELDSSRLTQTHLEQVSANKEFRDLQEFFAKVRYLHIVPQLVREPERSVGRSKDPFGGDFLEQLARTPRKTLESRLRRISEALRVAVPQLARLELERDERGVPHLKGLYEHWRPKAGWQTEDQFSDGTLRLLGLLWVLLDGNAPLLLEEPELSLHPDVVRYIPPMMARLGRKVGRQILVSTHSEVLLSDLGIALDEILMLEPTREDTKVRLASRDEAIRALWEGGVPVSEAVIPRTAPRHVEQLALFGD